MLNPGMYINKRYKFTCQSFSIPHLFIAYAATIAIVSNMSKYSIYKIVS